mgnify:CR=1 FL=1
MIELKPCPFCGGKPSIAQERYMEYYHLCHTCKGSTVQMHIHTGLYPTKQEAIEGWNRRTNNE